jgi:hypothetical protein
VSTLHTEVDTILDNAMKNISNEGSKPPLLEAIDRAQIGVQKYFGLLAKKTKAVQTANQVNQNEGTALSEAALGNAEDELISTASDIIEAAIQLASICTDIVKTADSQIAGLQPQLDPVLASLTDTKFVHNISSSLIISEDWQENYPQFTRLNVNTAFAFSGINQDDVEGQQLHWVGSVDYDLWRIYGYKVDTVPVPFLQSGEQAAQYADMLMARQYGTILQGSVTVRGDSKYQLGDCVFIEDEYLYYYISGIQHQFTYGQRYTTILTLIYGRRPGMFIPYPFDALGKAYTRGANIMYGKMDPGNLTAITEAFNKQESAPGDFNN